MARDPQRTTSPWPWVTEKQVRAFRLVVVPGWVWPKPETPAPSDSPWSFGEKHFAVMGLVFALAPVAWRARH